MSEDIWFGTSGPRDAQIMLLGEAWGAQEELEKRPFVGQAGQLLDKMLAEAGIEPKSVFRTNVINARPPSNNLYLWFHKTADARKAKESPTNGLYPNKLVLEGLRRLYAQVDAIQPKLIIGCGNYPFWAFSRNAKAKNSIAPSGWKVPAGIITWRGSQLTTDHGRPGYKFLPVIHPSAIDRQWALRPITVHDYKVRVPLALSDSWSRPARAFLAPPSFEEAVWFLEELLRRLRAGETPLVVDLETHAQKIIVCIGMTYDGETAISIPLVRPTTAGKESYWPWSQERELFKLFLQVFSHPNLFLIGQNFLYDMQYLHKWFGIRPPKRVFDTMIAQHVLMAGSPKTLWYLASLYCLDHYSFWKEEGKEWDEKLDISIQLQYNCEDCIRTWPVWQAQSKILQRTQGPQFAQKMEEWHLAFDIMRKGIRLDITERNRMLLKVIDDIDARITWLNARVPEWMRPPAKKGAKPWHGSNKQQMAFFYDILGCKTVHHRKTSNPTIDDDALVDIRLRYPILTRFIDTIREVRSLRIFRQNFLTAAEDPDGYMRCYANPAGTDTFRWSTSENAFGRGTNLQNIPKRDPKE